MQIPVGFSDTPRCTARIDQPTDTPALAADPVDSHELGNDRDKVILGWRYTFSEDTVLRASISQEIAEEGFGGPAVQFQMFF